MLAASCLHANAKILACIKCVLLNHDGLAMLVCVGATVLVSRYLSRAGILAFACKHLAAPSFMAL